MRSNTLSNINRNPDGNGSGNQGGGFQPSYQQPDGNGSGNQGGGFLPPAL